MSEVSLYTFGSLICRFEVKKEEDELSMSLRV